MENQEKVTDEQLKAFCVAVDEMLIADYGKDAKEGESKEDYAKRVHGIQPTTFERGQKWVRIVKNAWQRSAFCFVDASNGNIHKANTWKTPEKKHVRGNIKNGANDVTPYGAVYLRG